MQYLIIVVVILIILLVIINTLAPKLKKKKIIKSIDEYLNKTNLAYELIVSKDDIFDIDLKINNRRFIIKVVIIPAYSEVQINNKATWEIKYGAGNTPGKVQPHKRYLTEIIQFQNNEFIDATKVIIFSPKPKKIVKYINECEIVFVNSKTDVYGSRIISERQLAFFIKNE